MVTNENETLRWPTNLDRAAIVERLVQVRVMAVAAGLADLAAGLEGVEAMPSGEIGSKVIAALTWIQEKPEYPAITAQLAMVAMNLKNLK
ncbi:MAG TPA: hypothetical protein VMJ14_13185 [Burkholderiales bacterium]|nr:hypothetical protein [Burkholderiales bacterium]